MHIDSFEAWLYENERRKNTVRNYLYQVNRYILWYENEFGKNFDPAQVTSIELQKYKQFLLHDATHYRTEKRLDVSSVNTILLAIKCYFHFLVDINLIPHSPMQKVKNQKVQQATKTDWLNPGEKQELLLYLDTCDVKDWYKKRNKAVCLLMLYAGLRISEVASLNLGDLDFDHKNVSVRDGKGGKFRKIEMNQALETALIDWLTIRSEKPPKKATNHVFLSQKRVPLTFKGIEKVFDRISKETSLKNLHPHSLRHTFCHDLIKKGFPIAWVADVAGHSDLNTTRLYVRSDENERRNMLEALADD